MACRLENITDKKLRKSIEENGATVGTKLFLQEYANLVKQFETIDKVSSNNLVDINNSLQEHNSNEGTNHSLIISDGDSEFRYGTKELDKSKQYTAKLQLDWASSLNPASDTLKSIAPEDPSDPDVESFLRDLHGEEFTEPSINDYEVIDENLDFSEDLINEMFGLGSKPAAPGTGMNRMLSQAKSKIDSIRNRIATLKLNSASIEKEISDFKRKGITDDDAKIKSRVSRISAIEDKVSEYYFAMKELAHMFKAAKDDLNIDRLKSLFDFHKAFSLRMASAKGVEAGDLVLAIDAMKMWSGIRELVFDNGVKINDNILTVLQAIERDANDQIVNSVIARANTLVREDSLIPLEERDLQEGHDPNMMTRGVRALADTSVKMLSSINAWIQKANFMSNQEIVSIRAKVKNMFVELKKSGLSMESFIDETGQLVSRINNVFYKERQDMLDTFDKAILNARNSVTGMIDNKKAEKALLERNNWIKSRVYIIDSSKLSTEAGRLAVKAELVKITGDEAYAEDRIIDARMKYEQFERFVIRKTEDYRRMRANGEIKSDKELAQMIKNLTKFHSPVEYRKYINQTSVAGDVRLSDNYDKYATEIPLKSYKSGKDTGYHNEVFKNTILNNPKAFKFYSDYTNLMQQMISYLPSYATKGLSESFLPEVHNSTWKKLTKNGATGFFSGVKNHMVDSMTSEAGINGQYGELDANGKPKRVIPIKYINKIDVADKSRDLEEIANKFIEMAVTYKHVSQVEDKVKLHMIILKGMKGLIKSPDGTTLEKDGVKERITEGMKNAIAMAQHAIDNNFYGSRFEVEGFTNQKFFNKTKDSIKIIGSVNPVAILESYNNLVSTVGKDVANKEITKLFPDNVIIITEKDAYKDLKDKLMDNDDDLDGGKITQAIHDNREKTIKNTMNMMGRNLVISKGIDSVVQFSYLKSFAYNIFPAFANDIFGDIAIMNWASGRQDFTPPQARNALINSRIAVAKAMKTSSAENNKHINLAQKFGVVSDSTEGTSKDKSYNLNALSPFGFLASGDTKNRIATMEAYMVNQKINDKDGKERSLWEAFNNDGSWNVAEFGDLAGWNDVSSDINSNDKLFKMVAKIRQLNKAIHGNMDTDTSPEVKRHVLGRLLAQYRLSWMVEGIANRFENKRYDEILERDVEGKYVTTFKYMKQQGLATGLSTMLKLMAFQGEAAFNGQRISAKDKALVIANVRKTLHEMYYYMALWAMYLALSASLDDDDETQKYKYVALNTIYRTMGDISFYFQPSTINQIINNPIPVMGIMTDFGRFQRTVGKYMAGDDYYDESIVFRDFVRQIPVLNMMPKWQYRSEKLLMNQSSF